MNKPQTIRVLMIGPGEGIGGGIAALVETILPGLVKRVALHYLSSVQDRPLKDSGKLTARNIIIAFSQYFRFLSALVRFHPNIIHLHTSQGIAWLKDSIYVWAGKMVRCQVVLHMHGGNFDKVYNEYPQVIQAYTRRILNLADVVVSVSAEWKTRLARIISDEKIITLRNCIDIQSFQFDVSRTSNAEVHILFLGRIGKLKGVYDLINAMHILQIDGKSVHLLMVGPEENEGENQKVTDLLDQYQLAKTCEVVGSVERAIALQYYSLADIFVLPSYYEGLPMVVLEALAAGLPVIATPVGGIPEIVRDGKNGFLVPIGDVQALANRLGALISDADLRLSMGIRSREIAENELDVESYINRLVSLYSDVLGM